MLFLMGLELLPAAIRAAASQKVAEQDRREYERVRAEHAGRVHVLWYRFLAEVEIPLPFSDQAANVYQDREEVERILEGLQVLAEETRAKLGTEDEHDDE